MRGHRVDEHLARLIGEVEGPAEEEHGRPILCQRDRAPIHDFGQDGLCVLLRNAAITNASYCIARGLPVRQCGRSERAQRV